MSDYHDHICKECGNSFGCTDYDCLVFDKTICMSCAIAKRVAADLRAGQASQKEKP